MHAGAEARTRPTFFLDFDEPGVAAFARDAAGGTADPVEAARRLFAAVRDAIAYDPYRIDFTPEGFTASRCLARRRGYCVTKAVLLAASARAAGIPCRLGFADVTNHFNSPALRARMGTDLFVWHGYAVFDLPGGPVKAAPAFPERLCRHFGVAPLVFDGVHDALLQPLDARGGRTMAYGRGRGIYEDLPFETIRADMLAAYPGLYGAASGGEGFPDASFPETDES